MWVWMACQFVMQLMQIQCMTWCPDSKSWFLLIIESAKSWWQVFEVFEWRLMHDFFLSSQRDINFSCFFTAVVWRVFQDFYFFLPPWFKSTETHDPFLNFLLFLRSIASCPKSIWNLNWRKKSWKISNFLKSYFIF